MSDADGEMDTRFEELAEIIKKEHDSRVNLREEESRTSRSENNVSEELKETPEIVDKENSPPNNKDEEQEKPASPVDKNSPSSEQVENKEKPASPVDKNSPSSEQVENKENTESPRNENNPEAESNSDHDEAEREDSFLKKYMSDSEGEEEIVEEQKETVRKPEKKKAKDDKSRKRRQKIEKPPSRKPSMRWKNLRLVVGDDSDEDQKEVCKPPPKIKPNRKESRLNAHSYHRRSTSIRAPTELGESSTESEDEDDRVLDGKVSVADLPSEFWQIQRLVKFLKIGNQTATVITLCALTDFNLSQEMSQMAIREVNGLNVLVNILRTDHVNCQIGALRILQQLTLNSKYNRRTVINMAGVQILLDLVTNGPNEVQGLAAANLANMAKSSLGRNIIKRHEGIQKLVALLNYDNSTKGTRACNRSPASNRADLLVARSAALALWSCSKSTRSRSAIFKAGSVPLLAKLIQLDKDELLIPIVGLAQECAVEVRFRQAFYKENMVAVIVRRLQKENEELQGYCASAIFKCAEDEHTRKAVHDCGGLDTLVSLLSRQDNKKLLEAVTGAIWKCAISEYNVKRLMELKALETLVRLLQPEEEDDKLPEQVQIHIVGAIGEIAKDRHGPVEILKNKGCQTLVDILNIPNEELTGTAARAIATCAADSSCRALFNRLEGLRLLWSLMKSKNNKVVAGAAWAVHRLMEDTPEAWDTARSFVGGLELIVRLLKSSDLEVLTSACAVISVTASDSENLGVITDYGVVPHLAVLTNKTDIVFRRHLAEAIAMCSKWGDNAKRFCDEGAVEPMVEYLGSHDIIVQRSAMRALEQLGKNPNSCIIMHRSGVVKLLLEMIGSDDAALQEAAAGCLLNMRQLAMANERARYEKKRSKDLHSDSD